MQPTPSNSVALAAKSRTWRLDLLRYGLSGTAAFGVDMGTFFLLSGPLGLHPVQANLISRPMGGVASFCLHKFFTFQNRGQAATSTQFGRFWIVWLASFLVSQVMVAFYFEVVGFSRGLAKLGAEGAAGLFSFIFQRLWTFK